MHLRSTSPCQGDDNVEILQYFCQGIAIVKVGIILQYFKVYFNINVNIDINSDCTICIQDNPLSLILQYSMSRLYKYFPMWLITILQYLQVN